MEWTLFGPPIDRELYVWISPDNVAFDPDPMSSWQRILGSRMVVQASRSGTVIPYTFSPPSDCVPYWIVLRADNQPFATPMPVHPNISTTDVSLRRCYVRAP